MHLSWSCTLCGSIWMNEWQSHCSKQHSKHIPISHIAYYPYHRQCGTFRCLHILWYILLWLMLMKQQISNCPYICINPKFQKIVSLSVIHLEQTPILYAVQRNALFSSIRVRLATKKDEERIYSFLADNSQGAAHAADVMSAIEMNQKHRVYPYLMIAEDLMIGICILM